jgi:hypothetical protein
MPHPILIIDGVDPGKFETEEYELRDVPEGLPRVPFLAGVFGSRGAGKTTSMINLMRAYQRPCQVPVWDHIIVFTPTASKDPKYKALEEQLSTKDTKMELIEDFSLGKFQELITYMDRETKSYEVKKTASAAYKKWKEKNMDVTKLKDDELLALYSYDFEVDGKVRNMYKHGRPSFLMVFDDLVGEKLVYSTHGTNLVSKFALRHRHYNCTMIFLSQSWSNGVPRQIRHNLSLALFFKVNSLRLKQEVAEEMCSFISEEEFIQLWDEATVDQHDYFMIDFAAAPDRKFRKNLDTVFQGIHSSSSTAYLPPSSSRDPVGQQQQDLDPKEEKDPAPPQPKTKRRRNKSKIDKNVPVRHRARDNDFICKVGPGSLRHREILKGL